MVAQQIKLTNGITLIMDPMESVESLTISVFVEVGARHEEGFNNGISHCIEHMHFKGTERRSAQQIVKELDMAGGFINAYTSRERTSYYTRVLQGDTELAFDILSDMLCNSVFDEEELRKEKGVILQEIKEAIDDPSDLVCDLYNGRMFHGQQIGSAILGSESSVLTITRQEIMEYLHKYYTTDRIIVSVSGKLDVDHIVGLAHDYFGNVQSSSVNRFACAFEQQSSHTQDGADDILYSGGVELLQKDIEQVHLIFGFNAVSKLHDDYYTYCVASLITGGGMSSRLFQEVREKRGLVYSISSSIVANSVKGSWDVCMSSDAGKIGDALRISVDVVKGMCMNISEDEVVAAKAQMKSSMLMSQESSSYRSDKNANYYSIFHQVLDYREIMRKIDSINVDDVLRVMNKMINNTKDDAVTLAAVGDIKNFDADLLKNAF